jgi:hypothetical protein
MKLPRRDDYSSQLQIGWELWAFGATRPSYK